MEKGALTPQQRVGNVVATTLINMIYGLHIQDLGSFRAIRRDKLDRLKMSHPTYGWPVEMVVKAAKVGYRIEEIPIVRLGQIKGLKSTSAVALKYIMDSIKSRL